MTVQPESFFKTGCFDNRQQQKEKKVAPEFDPLLVALCIDGTFQAAARFQDSNIFQKAIKMVLKCILSVNSHLSGFHF